MAKHNYSQYSKKNNGKTTVIADKPSYNVKTTPEVKMESDNVDLVQETVDTVTLPATVEGVVANCVKLNVRAEPNRDSDIVCVLDAKSEIIIDVKKSVDGWFYVSTAGNVNGYCMQKYINAHL
ncbi:MAG: SH3 domain-containing protein [Bacteroidaceae bacterium]|nr:SH3 domain-containing protein [Bacteroidaceae bacterium]